MLTLEQYVGGILRGDDGAQPRALWTYDALESIARRALATAARPPFADPRHIAVALGLELLPRAPSSFCGEATTRGLIAYAWSSDERETGLRVAHGIAHTLLHRQFEASNDADAWVLTALLLLPRALVHTRSLDEVEQAARAPLWFVRAAVPLSMAWPDTA